MNDPQRVKVWDPLVRVFHWSLVISFFIAYFTEEDLLDLHVNAGYVVLGLVAFRIVWGVIGTRYARFSNFVYSPRTVVQFIKDTLMVRARRYLGHNPAGGAMIILLLVFLLITTISGIALYAADDGAGPMAGMIAHDWEDVLKELHEIFAHLTVVLVVIHVAGVILEGIIHDENLVKSMIHGYKRAEPEETALKDKPTSL